MMMKKYLLLSFVGVMGVSYAHANSTTAQDFGACPVHFVANQPPVLTGAKGKKLATKTKELCFHGFAVLHSGVSRTPIYSAEYLTKDRIMTARTLVRKDSFHVEERLPTSERAELNDYRKSGFDRGHLAPNGDMSNTSEQFDSFSLANIAPQNGTHNRGVWSELESDARNLAVNYGEAYVVTGVTFQGKNIASIGTGVLVPSHFFKAVYVPSLNQAGVYYSPNTEAGVVEKISLAELTARTGINAMPSLPDDVQNMAFKLPEKGGGNHLPKAQKTEPTPQENVSDGGWVRLLTEILKILIGLLK